MPDGRLVCYQHGDIVVLVDGNEVLRVPVFKGAKEKLIGRLKLAKRLLRLGIRAAEAVDNDTIVLSVGNILYELNINEGVLSKGYYCGEGIRPLTLTMVKGIVGFDDGIYFGGYLVNMDKTPVSIYRRIDTDKWEAVYTYPKGTINHVHNIVADHYRNCLWVFTGDFDEASAIWKVANGFQRVERFVSGEQKWRGCVAFATSEGLQYATDAPFAQNHIYLLKEDGSTDVIADLPGSCIYGCQWKDKYVFSTAVEADGRNETPLRLLFGWKRGFGIKDRYAHVYAGNITIGYREIYKEKKDLWPFIFQFGVFKFPAGINKTSKLYFQPTAIMKNDLNLLEIEDKE